LSDESKINANTLVFVLLISYSNIMKFDTSPSHVAKSRVGRPRKFDRNDVVAKAMRVFWTNGFTQTSIDDLVGGTNVGAQSLYNAFGNKKEIFIQALNLYLSTVTQDALKRAENTNSAIDGICAVFPLPSEITKLNQPLGCLMVMTSFETDKNHTTEIEAILDKQRVQAITAFMQALKRQKSGEINLSLNLLKTAKLLTTLLQGAQCDIRYGATDEDILQLRESIHEILRL